MSKEYKTDKEYSFWEIIRYNLRMWWLAIICAVLCAGVLGGYKYVTLSPYVDNQMYSDKMQVKASFFVSPYNNNSTVERANNIIKIAKSSKTYKEFCKQSGAKMNYDEYQNLFEITQTEASDIVSLYVTYPTSYTEFSMMEEKEALSCIKSLISVIEQTTEEMLGQKCLTLLDEPYTTHEVLTIQTYSISKDDFEKAVLKAATAGILLGVIVEIVLYTFWMLIYKKPKNAEEVRECLDTVVIDVFKAGQDDEDAYKKAVMFLADDTKPARICCLNAGCTKTDTALKMAMICANEQKKTLFIDMAAEQGEEKHSISKYILGEANEVTPLQMNDYLDSVSRNKKDEKGLNIAGNQRFAEYVNAMGEKYDCIVIGSSDVMKSAEGYEMAVLCGHVAVACGRKNVKNEALYKVKNTLDINGVAIDGVLVYEY